MYKRQLLDHLAGCDSNFAAEQCAAQLPTQFHNELTQQITRWLSDKHPGELFVFDPIVPTDSELTEMDKRVRKMGNASLDYLENPTGIKDYQTDPMEIPQTRWAALKQTETIDGQSCKTNNCENNRIKLGVFCPRHHFEMLYGSPPPNAT